MKSAQSILIVDADEQSAKEIMRLLSTQAAFSVSYANDAEAAMTYLRNQKPDLILLDEDLLRQPGFTTLKQNAQFANIPVILLVANASQAGRLSAEADAAGYVVKDKVKRTQILQNITQILQEGKAELTFDKPIPFFSQQQSLFKVLNKMSSGVIVVNSNNHIRFANTKAYSIVSDEAVKKHVAEHLAYRNTDAEELIELSPHKKFSISIRISSIDWSGERANLFLIDRVINQAANSADEAIAALLNTLHQNILLIKNDVIVQASKPALNILQYSHSEIKNKRIDDLLDNFGSAEEEISIYTFLSEKKSQGIITLADGSQQNVEFLIKPLNLNEEFYHLLTFDLLKRDDTIPVARSGEEKFSSESVLHMASHDLREPVRTILNYVQLVSENLQNNKIEQAREYNAFAHSAAERMEKLLSDLKLYIALNNHSFRLTKFSMKQLLAEVLEQLQPKIKLVDAEVSFTELPDVSADRELVEKLLLCLIENAIKFRKKERKPVIDIGFDKFEGKIIFCVRDNGIGVSKKYYSKIFEIFEKLNRVDEYPGNGLGLAISKKIAELHGGEIWVESLPGSGSNFYFTLSGK